VMMLCHKSYFTLLDNHSLSKQPELSANMLKRYFDNGFWKRYSQIFKPQHDSPKPKKTRILKIK